MPLINPQRVLADLRYLRTIGTYKTGVHRPTFSPADLASRQWAVERMEAAGLDARIDGIGNILGKSRAAGKFVLAGSHLETQNYAGWLDGALGVVYALEAARAIGEDASCGELGVDVVVLCDEEGHFGSFLGSRSFIGILEETEIDKAANVTTGTPLRQALAAAGYAGRPRILIDSGRYVGFFEAHIEQGDTLEASGNKIGIVSAIVGIRQYQIVVDGEQNHAGTTSMARRRDAGLAMVRLLAAIDVRFRSLAGPRTVWTTGRLSVEPGAKSIIPGRAEALFQIRDADVAVLERLDRELESLVDDASRNGPCGLSLVRLSASIPAQMNAGLMDVLYRAAEQHAPGQHIRMPSGAGHDAQFMARVVPSAMMFVPSINGISHHWAENTADADIVLGAQVFADAIALALTGEAR
ncbi:MAG: Zn-dependent hydrolase [Xanthobacteraceae bacterium]|nr:Zn-dependent hydrolase [Xanthobacteraceae bacterium]